MTDLPDTVTISYRAMKRSASKKIWWFSIAFAVAILLLVTPTAKAFAEEDEDDDEGGIVQDLSVRQYREILNGKEVWLIDFTKENCHACQQIKPILSEFAKEVKPYGIQVGRFEIEQDGAAKVIKEAGLHRAPTLRLLASPPAKNPYTGKNSRIPVDFPFTQGGSLQRNMLRDFLKKELPNKVLRVSSATYPEALRDAFAQRLGVVLTLTDREKTPTLLKSLALSYGEDFVFLEVPPSETDMLEAFRVTTKDLAQLYVLESKHGVDAFLPESLDMELVADSKYPGDLTAAQKVFIFIAQRIDLVARKDALEEATGKDDGSGKAKKGSKQGKDKKAPPAAGAELPPPEILALNATNFKEEVLQSSDAWMVWFQDAEVEEESPVLAAWEQYSGKAEGIVRCGVVECWAAAAAEDTVALCAKEAGETARFKAYLHGEEKEDESRRFATAEEAFQEAAASLPDVLKRVGDGANQYLLENEINMAFRSGRFPVLVFSKKEDPASLFRALALKVEPLLSFIFISSPSQETMARFNGANVPSVNVLVPQDMDAYRNKDNGVPAQHNLRIETYLPVFFGPMKFMSVINFFVQVLQRVDLARAQNIVNTVLPSAAPAAAAVPQANSISHVTDRASWEKACASSGALCVIGLFDGLPAGQDGDNIEGHVAGRNQELIQRVADAETAALSGGVSPWSFSWLDATCFRGFAQESFDVQEHALPTIVVYSPKKGRFAAFRGQWNAEAIREFLSGVLSGKFLTAPVLSTPTVEAEDAEGCYTESGSRGWGEGEPVEEEDIDDLMAEILEEERMKKKELAAALEEEQAAASAAAAAAAAAAKNEGGSGTEGKKKVVRRKKKKASDEL